jgi:hypothetical protein
MQKNEKFAHLLQLRSAVPGLQNSAEGNAYSHLFPVASY